MYWFTVLSWWNGQQPYTLDTHMRDPYTKKSCFMGLLYVAYTQSNQKYECGQRPTKAAPPPQYSETAWQGWSYKAKAP